jgi:UDP-glucose:(heptosyl)LPS alpha-1,3-glucosyltransferase
MEIARKEGKLRVAVVRQRYDAFGGAERFIARAMPALEQLGTEVTVIARNWDGWGARQWLKVDPFFIGRTWRERSFARAARAAWLAKGFDLVQSHERIPGCDVYRPGEGVHRRWLELRAARASFTERLGLRLSRYHRYLCQAEQELLEHPRLRAVICNSNMVRDEIRRGFRIAADKLHVIYGGVDLKHFHPERRGALRGPARAELGVHPRDTVFLFVGSDYARRGLDTAIDALALTGSKNFWLLVLGHAKDGPRFVEQAINAGLRDQVRFLGTREDLRPLYAAADCLVLPSRYDPFPNAALEALAMGLPVVVSERSGAAEVVRNGENGWVCKPNDVPGLARLMHEVDRAMRDDRMQQAARVSAERYGLEEANQQFTELYAKLAAGGSD